MDKSLFKTLLEFVTSLISGNPTVSASVSIPLDKPKEEAVTEHKEEPKQEIKEEAVAEPKVLVNKVKMVLTRAKSTPEGIFGKLCQEDGTFFAYTLEHAYETDPGVFKPKVAKGVYTCVRGQHRLHSMTEDFTTFEVKGVPDFQDKPVSGILFHWGNYQKDSDGCILLGSTMLLNIIGNSRLTFADFMKFMDGVDHFELTIE